MISWFQTASGAWHWPSVIMFLGWLVGSTVTGGVVFTTLYANRNERIRSAEVLQKTTEKLTLLEKEQAPWRWSSDDETEFTASLKDAPRGKVAIEYIRSDERRSYGFAVHTKEILERLGYDVWGYVPGFEQAGSEPLVGVMIQIKDHQSDVVGGFIQRAFKKIGINAIGVHRANNNYEDDRVVVWIGIKP